MSIDKFGRYLTNEDGDRIPVKQSTGITLSATGEFDAKEKRIKNLANPLFNNDAATVDFVMKKTNSCMRLKVSGYFDARNSFIRKVKDPVDKDDAVNKRYLDSLIPIKLYDGYSVGNLKVKDVAFPTNNGDAVNLQYITNHCVTYGSGVINGNNNIIKHIKDGTADSDAATVAYVKREMEEYKTKIEKTIINLGSALFHHIHGSGRASSAGLTETNYLDWNKIIN